MSEEGGHCALSILPSQSHQPGEQHTAAFRQVLLFDVVGCDESFDVYAGTLRVFVIKNEEH